MKRVIFATLLLVMIASACSGDEGVLSQIAPPPDPEQGKATVVGQVFNIETNDPLGDVIVRLAEIYRENTEEGVFLLDHFASPGARTDAQGIFIIENIEPGEYVLMVGEGDNFNAYDIIEDSSTGDAKAWVAEADQISDWGEIKARVLFR